MKRLSFRLLSTIALVLYQISIQVICNPLIYEPTLAPIMGIPTMPLQAPMLMNPHLEPYASMSQPHFVFSSPFGPMPFNHNRHSRSNDKGTGKMVDDSDTNDEKKAMGDLPLSFIDPEPPSTITERLSDSFSALGEGFRNHFKSLSENFSDTMDDIKDAWRSSDSSRKRS